MSQKPTTNRLPAEAGGFNQDDGAVTQPTHAALAELVQRFRVCWEAWPEFELLGHEKRQIGFVLELHGTHEPGVKHPLPGCPHCLRVFDALRTIADWILPREKRPSRYEIESYVPVISYSPARGNRDDVTLTIRILHREGYERPVDACEARCLKEMEARLKELGASEKQWVERKAAR
jgi:hypothetical protein